jgi:histidinol-phosphate aminotransferase
MNRSSRVDPIARLPSLTVVHGGPDAAGVPQHDFSTNRNAVGPCEDALRAVQASDPGHYPDPAYTALRKALGQFHGVPPSRVVLAASASEFIHRITALAAQQGTRAVQVPLHGFGEYARAALARGMELQPRGGPPHAPLQWACEPSSPLGLPDPAVLLWAAPPALDAQTGVLHEQPPLRVVDCAYAPLRLEGRAAWTGVPGSDLPVDAWQLWSPNKALGMTGVRAAYAIAPPGMDRWVDVLDTLAPAWPVGSHGVALLQAWVDPVVQRWLVYSLETLRAWKSRQQALCIDLGWAIHSGSLANYFCAQPDSAGDLPTLQARLAALRQAGIKLRDCTSFGLPGSVRLGVLAPQAQDALRTAWLALRGARTIPAAPAHP